MLAKKVYSGWYDQNNPHVEVDGVPLRHVNYHSNDLSWGFNGSNPADLALSILADYFGEDQITGDWLRLPPSGPQPKCWFYHQDFKRDITSGLPQGAPWQIDSDVIDQWLTTEPPMP